MTILEEAQELTYGERQNQYGDAHINYGNIAKLWSVILKTEVTPEQVCLCMVMLKVARQVNKHKRDNIVDAAGYLALIEKMEVERSYLDGI